MASSYFSPSHPCWFVDFLHHYEYVTIEFIDSGMQALQDPFVVIAHIIGIISTTARSIELLAKDQTGTTIFCLRDMALFQFYEEHLPEQSPSNSNGHPFALDDSWFRTCLFKLDWTKRVMVDGRIGHVVTEICMSQETIDEFMDSRMTLQTYRRYTEEIASAVPLHTGYLYRDTNIASYIPRSVGVIRHFRRRLFADYTM